MDIPNLSRIIVNYLRKLGVFFTGKCLGIANRVLAVKLN